MEKDITESALSTAVQDIIERPPHWLIRWGNAIIVGIMLLLLVVAWVIKLPTKVEFAATVTFADQIAIANENPEHLLLLIPQNYANNLRANQPIYLSFTDHPQLLPHKATVVKVASDSKSRKALLTIAIELPSDVKEALLPEAKVAVSVITGEERVLKKVVQKIMPKVILEAM
jgi:hypothetical protein